MTSMRALVRPLDVSDQDAFRAWFAVREAAENAARPGEQGWSFVEQWAEAATVSSHHVRDYWTAVLQDARSDKGDRPDRGDRPDFSAGGDCGAGRAGEAGADVVGAARLVRPLTDNARTATLEVFVRPDVRRRGVGSALLQAALERAVATGRAVAHANVGRPTGEDVPGDAFARRHGFMSVRRDERRELRLPVDADIGAALEAEARAHAGGYELLSWVGATPDDLLDARARLAERISADAPNENAAVEAEHWDAARVRERDAYIDALDRDCVAVAVRHRESGELVGVTDITVPRAVPELAWQWDTVVEPAHRGHRLGMLLKLENLRLLARTVPATTRVATFNARSNRPMIRVNEQLGFRPAGEQLLYERAL